MKRAGPKNKGSAVPPRSWPRVFLIVLCALAAAAVVSGAVVWVVLEQVRSAEPPLPSVGPAVQTPSLLATPPPTPPLPKTELPPPVSTPLRSESETFALMLLAPGSRNIDSFFLGRLDREHGTLDIVSLPKDTLVNVPWQVKKLTTLYSFTETDCEAVLNYLARLTGFRADHYMVLTESTLEELFDLWGGVEFNVLTDMHYDDPIQNLHIHVPSGERVLTGSECVQYMRYRSGNDGSGYPDGDLGRVRAQQKLLAAFVSQLLQKGGTVELERAIPKLVQDTVTDLTPEALDSFAVAFGALPSEQVRFSVAPGSVVGIRGGSYYQLEPREWTAMINASLNPRAEAILESELDVLREFGDDGAISTSGQVVPLDDFFDYSQYSG